MASTRPKRFIVAADNHGDMVDPQAKAAIMAFARDFAPDIAVHLGDNWDFRNLRKGASDDEKASSLEDDWEQGREFLREFLSHGKTTRVFLRGNHDERVWRFRESATGLLRDYAADGIKRIEGILKQARATMLPYDAADGIYRMGKLAMLHGYHVGVGAVRQHAAIYGSVIFGHVHTIESSPVASTSPAEARSIGCLCRKNMSYINAKTGKLRWSHGWAYGFLFDDGSYQLFQAREINHQYHAATEIKTY